MAQKTKFDRATELTRAEFESLYDELARLIKEHERIGTYGPRATFWGFFPEALAPAGELEIEQAISDALPAVETLKHTYVAAAEVLGEPQIGLSRESAAALAAGLTGLASLAPDGMAEEMLSRLAAWIESAHDESAEEGITTVFSDLVRRLRSLDSMARQRSGAWRVTSAENIIRLCASIPEKEERPELTGVETRLMKLVDTLPGDKAKKRVKDFVEKRKLVSADPQFIELARIPTLVC